MTGKDPAAILKGNPYPGRGIVIGKSADGKSALFAYFIMGRSSNSRNRVFERFSGGLRTKAFDEALLTDPRLIIYNPYLSAQGGTTDIVTNGDQTNTIFDYINKDNEDRFAFERALYTRSFEPDAPNFTPRISGILSYDFGGKAFSYKLSVLKSADGRAESSRRYFFGYEPEDGVGHFIHTYKCDGNPLPSFEGEPVETALPNTAAELGHTIWDALNAENKVSLFVRCVPLDGAPPSELIFNKNVQKRGV